MSKNPQSLKAKKKPMFEDYIDYQLKYEKMYGPNTVVLYQNGSFFEVYGVDNDEEKIGYPALLSKILNIQLTRRDKSILENNRSNHLIVGFPTHALQKFIPLIHQENMTIVLIEQVTEPPEPVRDCTAVLSPSTYIENNGNRNDNHNLVSFYIEEFKDWKSGGVLVSVGLSVIDLSTGKSQITQIKDTAKNLFRIYEDCYRFMECFNPIETVIYNPSPLECKTDELVYYLETNHRIIHKYDELPDKVNLVSYQNEFLTTIFPNTGLLSVIEFLDLEFKPEALMSFILLLRFAYEHDTKIVQKINKPDFWEGETHLVLNNNAIYQLNVFSNQVGNGISSGGGAGSQSSGETSIFSLFDVILQTSTSLGKRLLKNHLLQPLLNKKEIEERYDKVEFMMENHRYLTLEKDLKMIVDIERMNRRMSLGKLQPTEYASLEITYDSIIRVYEYLLEQKYPMSENSGVMMGEFKKYLDSYRNDFKLDVMSKYNMNSIEENFFRKGMYEAIDKIQKEQDDIYEYFKGVGSRLSSLIEEGSEFVKVETQADSVFLAATMKRCAIIESKLSVCNKNVDDTGKVVKKKKGDDNFYIFEDIQVQFKKFRGSELKIVSPVFEQKVARIFHLKEMMKKRMKDVYLEYLDGKINEYHNVFAWLNDWIAEVDVFKSHAKCAKKFSYKRPRITEYTDDNGSIVSYLDCKGLRHPIIERIQKDIEFIPNDIRLCRDGILLFGLNGGGKSSLLKAVGLTVILAQMGSFVPCEEMVFYPFKTIYTRIMGTDNIFKGMSSFALEMNELKTIYHHANGRSLVLGDEICRGTELDSAISICTTVIEDLANREIPFLMATHIHDLVDQPEIKNLGNIHLKHLGIEFSGDKIIFGRKLEDGNGIRHYGLEVAEYIIQSIEFNKKANFIRNRLMNKPNDILKPKQSYYNSGVFVHCCGICGSTEEEVGKGNMDVHHIKFQNMADEDGMIGTQHKNHKSNLVVLCEKHHNAVHNDELIIYGYKKTVNGIILDYKENDKKEENIESKKIKSPKTPIKRVYRKKSPTTPLKEI